jgi:hypothetical protein
MDPNDRWEQVVSKLVDETKLGRVRWARSTPPRTAAGENVLVAYTAPVSGKTIACYEYDYRYYLDEDEFVTMSDVAIEFVDERGVTEWRFPQTPRRRELLDAIRYCDAGADDFLRSFLPERRSA